MVKRCCAKSCYNSQLTHKIGYFGFPKNEVIAREWARLAGRDDLVNKKLENLTKYYLCSDHFVSKDFANPNVEDRSFLVLNRTANFIPLPSQFENNLQQNVEFVLKNSEKFMNYTRKESQTVETVRKNQNQSRQGKRKLDHVDGSDFKLIQVHSDEQENPNNLFECTDIEITRMDNPITEEYIEELDNLCRLCAKPESELVPIFNDDGEFTAEALCVKIMPQSIIQFNDGLPQLACMNCLEKLHSCVNIIDGFILNQDLFIS